MDCDDHDCSAVMVQGEGEEYRVVAMGGRELQATEQAASLLERLLLTAMWAIKRWARFTLYLPSVVVVLPHPAAVISADVGQALPPRLQARLIELSSYRATFESGDGAWAVGGAVARLKGTVDVAAEGKLELWQHVERVLR